MSTKKLTRRVAQTIAATLTATILVTPQLAGAKARKVDLPKMAMDNAAIGTVMTSPHASESPHFFTINEVLAIRSGHRNPAEGVEFATAVPTDSASDAPVATVQRPVVGDGPFGLVEFRAPEGQIWSKWRKVEADITRDLATMRKCRSEPEHCLSRAAERFNTIIDEARTRQGHARLASVNRAVNEAIRYTTDFEQFGVADLWSAPLATFTTGRGDCEDYAIAKYVALKEAGVAETDLRLLLVRDQVAREDHAVVAARQDGHWVILDNRFLQTPDVAEMWNFEPLYAMDEHGVQLLAADYANQAKSHMRSLPAAAPGNSTPDIHEVDFSSGKVMEAGAPIDNHEIAA
jgi:predicted transglutaminase-like cysteine proteinase